MKIQVHCPRCKTLIEYSPSNPHRPFCSERCQLIDLGKWANEEYNIPMGPQDIDSSEDSIQPESPLESDFEDTSAEKRPH